MSDFFGNDCFKIEFNIKAMGQQFDNAIFEHSKYLSNMLEKGIAELIKNGSIEMAIKNEAKRIVKNAIYKIALEYGDKKIDILKAKIETQIQKIIEEELSK